ncbi:E3 ubiquitin-protein ligase PUB22-like [Typha angustifolia]|uniref:E3 ubiquitin-protein ligase PUB22-like n=1 Tax=Typha angustifolia TaxID=59011 RepID=UPI003C2FA255
MELMEDPVTISTGVTYEKKNIEKWLVVYKKSTCPATMQRLDNFDLTPNHTLKRVISSWLVRGVRDPAAIAPSRSRLSSAFNHEMLSSLLADVESSPFKVSSLKALKSSMDRNDDMQKDFIKLGGVRVLSRVMFQVITTSESNDFNTFRACEEAVSLLSVINLSDEESIALLLKPECMKPMMVMLQRGCTEARLHTMTILKKISKSTNSNSWVDAINDQDMDLFKSLLELLSDEISTKLSSCSLDILLEIISKSKNNRVKAIEAGAVRVSIELLPDATRHHCEKILLLLRRLCECPEGRSAFADHGLGIAAVAKKILRVSEIGTKLGVKILWLMCSFLPTEKVVEDMMVFGAVKKLFGLLHMDGRSSTKERAIKIVRLHGPSWRQYPCFPCELQDYLRVVHQSN